MTEHQPQPGEQRRDPQLDAAQDPDTPLDDLDAETVEDLDVDEDAEDVKGGVYTMITVCPSMPPCATL